MTRQSFEPSGKVDARTLRKLTDHETMQRVVQQLVRANRLRELAFVVKAVSRLIKQRAQLLVSRAEP